MNPFEVQSAGHQMLQKILAEPVNGTVGGQIIYPDVNGSIYPATISTFKVIQELDPKGGGLTPKLVGSAIITKTVLPDSVVFKSRQLITVVMSGGHERQCQIESVDDQVTEWWLELVDRNQGA